LWGDRVLLKVKKYLAKKNSCLDLKETSYMYPQKYLLSGLFLLGLMKAIYFSPNIRLISLRSELL